MVAGKLAHRTGDSRWWALVLCRQLRPVRMLEPYSMVFIIFVGTIIMAIGLTILLLISYFTLGNEEVLESFILCPMTFLYLLVAGLLIRHGGHNIAAWMLVALYEVIAVVILLLWSINVPTGVLMLAFTIILAGALLGVRWIIPVTVTAAVILVIIQALTSSGMIQPDTSGLVNPPNFGDVAGYGTIFIVFAVIMWLSRLRLEQTLQRALSAERALGKEKASLSARLQEETRHLKDSQLEEIRQLYRFSELGQASVTLLHELANHLAVITLDVDALDKRHRHSKEIGRLKRDVEAIDGKIRRVRRQLKQSTTPQRFAVFPLLGEVVAQLKHKSDREHVRVKVMAHGEVRYTRGDPQKLFQALTILVTNAIEAYHDKPVADRRVLLELERHESFLELRITDHGSGIPPRLRRHLFKPFMSTKKDGMGIGLFIADQTIRQHMAGSIHLDPRTDQTTFVIRLPVEKS